MLYVLEIRLPVLVHLIFYSLFIMTLAKERA